MRKLSVWTFCRHNCWKTHTYTPLLMWTLLLSLRGLYGDFHKKNLLNRSSSSLQLVFTGLQLWNSLSITEFIIWVEPQTNPVWKHKAGTPWVCVCGGSAPSDEFRVRTANLPLWVAFVFVCVCVWQGCREVWLNESCDEGVGLKQLSLSKCLLPSRITLQQFFKHQTKVSTVEPLSVLSTGTMLTSFAGCSSVSSCTHTCAILWRAGSSVLAGAAEWTVGSPEALWAHTITVDSCGHIMMTNIQWIRTKEDCRNIPSSLPSVKRHQAGRRSQWPIMLDRPGRGFGWFFISQMINLLFPSLRPFRLSFLWNPYFWSDGAPCQSAVLINRVGSRERPSLSPIPFQQSVQNWKEAFMGQVHTLNTVCLAEIDHATQNNHTGLSLCIWSIRTSAPADGF